MYYEVVIKFYCRFRKDHLVYAFTTLYLKDFKDPKLCALEIVPLIFPVFWIVYVQLKERIMSPNNRKLFVYDCMLTVKIVHYQD